ncbi:MAG: hypothetical protein GY811_11205 [Myxococcales bacterium]|nr:hypothetical protein [Myxococcales bacterium]
MKYQKSKLIFLGLPLLVLFFAGLAMTAFLSVNLLVQGLRAGAIGQIALGGIISAMWLFMLYKTAQARRRVTG